MKPQDTTDSSFSVNSENSIAQSQGLKISEFLLERCANLLLEKGQKIEMLPSTCSATELTWNLTIIVQMRPRVSLGFPSTISSGRMFTRRIWWKTRKERDNKNPKISSYWVKINSSWSQFPFSPLSIFISKRRSFLLFLKTLILINNTKNWNTIFS